MRRGEIWTVAGGGDYSSKPRPAVIIQDDRFDATDSVTICLCTTDPLDLPLIRILIEPDAENGFSEPTRIMVDKIVTVHRRRLGTRLGQLDDATVVALNRAILAFLGIATPRATS